MKTEKPMFRLDMDGTVEITLRVLPESKHDAVSLSKEACHEKYNVEIKPYRRKRSLDANAYMWVLLQKLAEKMESSKEEVYLYYVRRIGPFEIVPVKQKHAEFFVDAWKGRGLGWHAEIIGDSKIEGYKNVICYYGSSVYDSGEMSWLIRDVVYDCKEHGIETMTPEELDALMEGWHEKHITG